jgi:L-lactate dehydrogenase complex protein LldF
LQTALDNNANRRRAARKTAFNSLPENYQDMRKQAREVRGRVINNLEFYLQQFIINSEANGFIIHRAATAENAVRTLLDITNQHDAKLIAKSKTMIGEEIRLNQSLEKSGMQVVETDLGEYIIQLRGEPPAHIITPAVHLSREEVGKTFEEKLGTPFTDDVQTLTEFARSELRQTFLQADIGISGVNFGVVENGSICLVTNEGNGRMVTTLPPVHIGLMGIERLVPNMSDLALMLYLLPRSATGQKLTVYTNLIKNPRLDGEIDGSIERHLILVDNGRMKLRGSSIGESLFCIRCGACLNACPVFQTIGGHAYVGKDGQETPYTGPIGSVVSPGLFGIADFGHLARASSLCGACKDACPVDIDFPKLLLRIRTSAPDVSSVAKNRANHYDTFQLKKDHVPRSLKWGLGIFTWLAASPWRFGTAQRLAGFFSRLISPGSAWLRMPPFTGWGYSRDMPRPASRPFRDKFEDADTLETDDKTIVQSQPETSSFVLSGSAEIQGSGQITGYVARFEEEFTALGGHFIYCQLDELNDDLLGLLEELGVESIQAWDEKELPVGLINGLQEAGIQVSQSPDPDIRIGLTGATAGIAESGTLVVPGGKGRSQTASLLPEIHIAVINSSAILGNLTEALELGLNKDASMLSLITGPSRTADIEMTLSIGVHGPKEIFVFCLDES